MEKIIVAFLTLLVLISGSQIVSAFYREHSEILPSSGGIYTEGIVGKIELINPLFVRHGSPTHDLTLLVFSGLTRYNPETGEIEPDLADVSLSDDKKTYTFTLRENARWHDGTPVTSDDVIFTYEQVIQNPGFRGLILNYNDYSGLKLAKVDERTVKFLLQKPDSFFLVKTLPGLLPKHLLAGEVVETLENSFFNQLPIGSGPYKLISVTPFEGYAEATLEVFNDYYGSKPNIETIVIRVFPTFRDLLKNQSELDGIRSIPDDMLDKVSSRFVLQNYTLPQYVAVFVNTQSPILSNAKVRLGLQLGTDKDTLLDLIGQTQRVDTPLLEIDQNNWVYQYSVKKANGALFDTEWKLPEKPTKAGEEPAETPAEPTKPTEDDTTAVTYINNPNGGKDLKTHLNRFVITGTAPKNTKTIFIDDYELKKYVPGDPGWSYVAAEDLGNLKKGKNVFMVYALDTQDNKTLLDGITITYGDETTQNNDEAKMLEDENKRAPVLPTRTKADGTPLALRLIAPAQPAAYGKIAEILKKLWQKIGVELSIEVLENEAFQEKLAKRDYDLLIFGQNLGYNLDAFPYWHSSQAKEGGYNLSQFKNFIADSLLENARLEHDEEDRKEILGDLQQIMSSEIPAIFLYSPVNTYALSGKVQHVTLSHLATTSDRFAGIETWYAKGKRKLMLGTNPLTFIRWILKQF